MKLIGRDKLLKREIYPRLKNNVPFILTGQRGIGKTSLLRWAHDAHPGPKLLLTCREAYGALVKRIAQEQGLKTDKMKIAAIETEVLKGAPVALFLDDIERMTPKAAGFFTQLNETWLIWMTGVEPFREELKRLTWGKQKVHVAPLVTEDRAKLADLCAQLTGSRVSRSVIAASSRGVPARAWAIARGEPVRDADERVEGEEINFLPVMLLLVSGIMIMRFVGKGMGEQDIYIMGGIGMGAAVFLRYFIFKGASK